MSIMPSRSISAKLSKLWTYSGISSRVTRQNEFTPLRLNSPDDASVKVSFVVLVVVVDEEVPLIEALVVVVVVLLLTEAYCVRVLTAVLLSWLIRID